MGYYKPLWLFFFFVFFSACVSTNFSQAIELGGSNTACLQKLLPCKNYVKSPSPPSSCCDPLKSMISTDTQCLCKVFNDPESLKSLSITQDDALGLAKSCGANPDVSVCKSAEKSGSANATSSTSTNTTTSSPTKSEASAISSPGRIISSLSIAFSVASYAIFSSH
ncbi:lipid transfer-like protein VAS [Punica granatum]|uniref:Bifunctional inhibitor/plant lipid transfer protein/seed storage helical domain-containing protein n=2 Tax=Punica granatum TaxID=22663 RepID=A0A218XDG7_PUNGR|nr:lipid transfer-like protein VAS [Punica granatum]OWM82983.1 hypothetical protein CDL15_Pgr005383 [Punica granatum]PKI77833.1 hypothetical protein CRG98_001797 [Punica granatum]